MKFAQLEKSILSLEDAEVLPARKELESLLEAAIAFSETDKDLESSMEEARVALSDIATLQRIQSGVSVSTESAALSQYHSAYTNIANRYSLGNVAQEGLIGAVASAIASVFKFFFNIVKSVVGKVGELLGFGKDAEEKIAATSNRADGISVTGPSFNASKAASKKPGADPEFAKFHKDGYLLVDKFGFFSPVGRGNNIFTQAYGGTVKVTKAAAAGFKQCVQSISKGLAEAKNVKPSEENYEAIITRIIKDTESSFSRVLKKENDNDHVFEIANHHNFIFTIDKDTNTVSGSTKDVGETQPVQLTFSDYKSVLAVAKNNSFSDIFKDITKAIDGCKSQASSLEKYIGGLSGDEGNIAASGIMKILKFTSGLLMTITRAIYFFIKYENDFSSLCHNVYIKFKKFTDGSSYATEDAELNNGETNYVESFDDEDFSDLESIAEEAKADYDEALESLREDLNYVKSRHGDFSIEAYIDYLNDKYSYLGISVEDADPVKEEPPKEDAKKEDEEKEEGLFARIKSIIKSILDFFVALFKKIKDKIFGLFTRSKKVGETIEKKQENIEEDIEKIKKAIESKETMEKVKESPKSYEEEVTDYWLKNKAFITIDNPRFVFPKEFNFKYLEDLSEQLKKNYVNSEKAIAIMLPHPIAIAATVDKVEAANPGFNDAMENHILNMKQDLALSLGKLDIGASEDIADMAIAKFGESYLGAEIDLDTTTVPVFEQINVGEVTPIRIEISRGDVIEAAKNIDDWKKFAKSFLETSEAHVKKAEKNHDIFLKSAEQYANSAEANQNGVILINSFKNYLSGYIRTVGTVAAFNLRAINFMTAAVEAIASHEAKLANPKPVVK